MTRSTRHRINSVHVSALLLAALRLGLHMPAKKARMLVKNSPKFMDFGDNSKSVSGEAEDLPAHLSSTSLGVTHDA